MPETVGRRSAFIGRPSLLVVDDETMIREVTSRRLLEAGYDVHQAVNGHEALQFVRGGQIPIACVISDIVMPHLNGVELLRHLTDDHPGLPVILMSAHDADFLKGIGVEPPCGYLVKPFPMELLLTEVERCLEERVA